MALASEHTEPATSSPQDGACPSEASTEETSHTAAYADSINRRFTVLVLKVLASSVLFLLCTTITYLLCAYLRLYVTQGNSDNSILQIWQPTCYHLYWISLAIALVLGSISDYLESSGSLRDVTISHMHTGLNVASHITILASAAASTGWYCAELIYEAATDLNRSKNLPLYVLVIFAGIIIAVAQIRGPWKCIDFIIGPVRARRRPAFLFSIAAAIITVLALAIAFFGITVLMVGFVFLVLIIVGYILYKYSVRLASLFG